MADDMEIGSDHGHGDDDIDIDIDLTADQVDEDYILEDAVSTTGDNALHLSPPLKDDLMLDETEELYPMVDADVMNEVQEQDIQEFNMDGEGVGMSFEGLSEPYFDENSTTAVLDNAEDPFIEQNELSWEEEAVALPQDNIQPQEVEIGYEEAADLKVFEQTSREGKHDLASRDAGFGQESVRADDEHESRTITPHITSPENRVEATSPSFDQDHQASGNLDEVGAASVTERNVDGAVSEHSDNLHKLHGIKVFYQTGEYSLFNTTNSGDPDSFFLSDLSVANKPISGIFQALRDIIHEDLAPDEELWISIEDMRLEVEETVCSLYDVTLLQICELYQKLLFNDGVDSPRPLSIRLGSRPSFAKKLANLMAEADSGRGLSQLIVWDEGSEDVAPHDDNGEIGGLDEFKIDGSDNKEHHDGSKEEVDVPETGIEAAEPLDDSETTKTEPQQQSTIELTNTEDQTSGTTVTSTAADAKPRETADATKKVYSGDLDEDGDIIDYSEDEDVAQPVREKTENNIPKLNTDDRNHVEEYKEINDELERRRSLSRASGSRRCSDQTPALTPRSETKEQHFVKGANEPAIEEGEDITKSNEIINETSIEANEELWDEDETNGNYEYLEGEITDANNDPTRGNEEAEFEIMAPVSNVDTDPQHKYIDVPEELTNQSTEETRGDNIYANDNDVEENLDGDEEGFQQSGLVQSEVTSFSHAEDGPLNGFHSNPTHDNPKSKVEVTANGGILEEGPISHDENLDVLLNSTILQQEDEIGYEDDEDDQLVKPSELNQPVDESLLANPGSGKRPRIDLDSDEAMTARSKDAKRSRS